MTVRNGKGWVTLRGARVAATGETALQAKARDYARRQAERGARRQQRQGAGQ
ncbi:MAG: hypothetical protein R3C14_22675 [Caldilineaceae bacterium]